MKKELIIFGTGKIADVIYYYATQECDFKVAAFVVDEKYKTDDTFHDLPVVPFENVTAKYPPDKYEMFVAVGYHNLNKVREDRCREAIAQGYNLVSIISKHSNVPKNVVHGRNCFIMPPCIIHPCVELGDNVFVWSGAMIGHHSRVGDHCWLTSCCNVSGNVNIGRNTFIAVNATIAHNVVVGEKCFLGANTLLTKNIEDNGVLITESTRKYRLNSEQFLRFSNFSSI